MNRPAPIARSLDLRTADPDGGSVAFLRVGPGRWIGGFGPFERAAHPPAEGVAFYVNDFGLGDAQPWWIPAESRDDLPAPWPDVLPEWTAPVRFDWRDLPRERFGLVFEEIAEEIRSGRLRKAVLALAQRGRLREGGMEVLLARAMHPGDSTSGWGYGFRDRGRGFAGVTPECLFSVSGNRVQTMALAGTARPADRVKFAEDPKEIAEHQIVVESLMANLSRLGRVHRGPREIVNVGELLHFVTRFQIETDHFDAERWIERLHPTPAIGVMPSTPETLSRLMQWRGRLDAPREFGAPFAVKWSGGIHAVVAIRGASWCEDEVFLPAGCGIVEGSQLEREWRELALKRDWVKRALGLA